MYRAVLFDLDGTLLNTFEDLADTMNSVLAAHEFPTHAVDAYRYFIGNGMPTLVARAIPAAQRESGLLDGYVRELRAAYAEKWNVKTCPYDGVPEMLDNLTTRGLTMSVLSNKPQDMTVQCVREYFPGTVFASVRGHSAAAPLKPDPAAALDIVRLMGCTPEECAFLGDTAIDMSTATAAGMLPVGALWGFRDEKELREAGAKHLISRPAHLIDLIV